MKDGLFAELMTSMSQALDHAQGKRDLRTTVLPEPPAPMSALEVQRVRKRLNASQAVFARYLNVSTKLVQAWEASRREPDGPALVLLRLGARDPALLAATAFEASPTPLARRGSQRAPTRPSKSTKRRSSKAPRRSARTTLAPQRPRVPGKGAGEWKVSGGFNEPLPR